MSEAALIVLIKMACASYKGEDRIICYDNITNCSIKYGTKVTKEQAETCANTEATNKPLYDTE